MGATTMENFPPFFSDFSFLWDLEVDYFLPFFSFVNCFVIAFCVNEWMLYIGAAFSILDATSTTMFR